LNAGQFIFRLPGAGTEELINRKEEYISNKLACELGLDIELINFDVSTGIKVCKCIPEAITMSPERLCQETNIKMAAAILRTLHSTPVNTGVDFGFTRKVEEYEKLILKNKIALYSDYSIKKQQVLGMYSSFHKHAAQDTPCHNDPLCENWVYGNNRMYLIDWEYAGMNDPMWDVAVVSVESGMSSTEDDILLTSYLGKNASNEDYVHFLANKVNLDFLWSLWGKTRVAFSDKEMEEYARNRYDRMCLNLEKLQELNAV
jgi:thiamine kinase-like enzyme